MIHVSEPVLKLDESPSDTVFDRRSSGDQVASYIREQVFTGRLRRGDRVRQDDVATELRVSRIPVREAMIALDREGWVTIEPHRGAYVNGLDEKSVLDHYEFLGLLYGLAGRRAAENADDAELVQFEVLRKAVSAAEDPAELQRCNEAYIKYMYRVANSPRLSSVSRVITGIVPGNFFARVPGAMAMQKRGLTSVTKGLRARDGDKVARAWTHLLRTQGVAVVQLLRTNDVLSNEP